MAGVAVLRGAVTRAAAPNRRKGCDRAVVRAAVAAALTAAAGGAAAAALTDLLP